MQLREPGDPFHRCAWLDGDATLLPDAARRVPTMLSEEEQRLLFWLTAQDRTGDGAVVDLGCFAGGSSARLAAGLVASGRPGKVDAYDFFRLSDDQKQKYLYPAGVAPFEGRDMLSRVRDFLSPWADRVTLHQGDIGKAVWHGGEIDILFIDAAKRPALADHIAATFFPSLVPGRSVVVQQDYQHWRQPWVAAQMEMMSDRIEVAGWCSENSVILRPTAELTPGWLADRLTAGLDDAEMSALLRRAMARFADGSPRTHLARAILAIEDNPGVRAPRGFRQNNVTARRMREVLEIS